MMKPRSCENSWAVTDAVLATSYILAALAIFLAWPAPLILSRAAWPARSPFVAMILWQAIALAGGLSMIGSMLLWGLSPLSSNIYVATNELFHLITSERTVAEFNIIHVFAVSTAGLLFAHLSFSLLLTFVRIYRQRIKHRNLVEILSAPSATPNTVVIEHPVPVAYCLPGGSRGVTVMSDGLVAALSPQELDAVLTHERAHLAQRHHLLLWAFSAWRTALPWLPTSRLAQQAVNSLIEMLADDSALATTDRGTLVRAIAVVATGQRSPGTGSAPGITDNPGSTTTGRRLSRLLSPQAPLTGWQRGAVMAISLALLGVPTLLVLAPYS